MSPSADLADVVVGLAVLTILVLVAREVICRALRRPLPFSWAEWGLMVAAALTLAVNDASICRWWGTLGYTVVVGLLGGIGGTRWARQHPEAPA